MIEPSVVDGIRKNARVFQAIIDIADEMEKIGGLENAGREAETRLSKLRDTEQNLSSELQSLREDIAKMSGDRAEHLERIEGLIQGAQMKASEMLRSAKSQADDIIKAARDSGDKIISDANVRAGVIDRETDNARCELQDVLLSVSSAKSELDSLRSAIDSLKSKFI